MNALLDVLVFIVMGLIAYYDFKSRSIWLILFPITMIILFLRGILKLSFEQLLYNSMINIGFVFLQFFLVSIYFSLKNRRLTNIINKYIGLADILLMLAFCFCFSPLNFMVFIFFNLLICLIIAIIIFLFNRKISFQLPFAGILALSLCILIIGSYFNNAINFFSDENWITLMAKVL